MAESTDLKSVKCGFDSHQPYQNEQEILEDFLTYLLENSVSMPKEFADAVNEEFWNLL